MTDLKRPSGRAADELRPIILETNVTRYAEGSCIAKFGHTHVLCTASWHGQCSAMDARQGYGLGDRRIWHAAARNAYAWAGGKQRQENSLAAPRKSSV